MAWIVSRELTRKSAGSVLEIAIVMTLKRAEVNEGGACLPCAGKKRRVVSGRSHSLVVRNLKSAFADFEIIRGKSCACDAVERVSQLNDIWKWSHGLKTMLQRKRC